jgi:hypothetical protein
MAKPNSRKREDEVLLRMLKTPPKPYDETNTRDGTNPKTSEAPQ